MGRIIILLMATVVAIYSYADTFRYYFTAQPLAKALSRIADEHPDIEINFIYNELENYMTTASVNTSDAYEAMRKVIGLNPVTILQKGNIFYIEALQHGKYCYTGRAVGTDSEPVIAASVMLLAPKDSTVITYGITDGAGRFSIPCDRKGVIVKLTCIGYKTTYRKGNSFSMGTIIMPENPIDLSEVKVENDNFILIADKNVFLPTQRQKRASQNAIDLLQSMAIPTLIVEHGSKTVKDVFGNAVSLFIDYLPAESHDLDGMKTTDVKRVEILDAPSDPRFRGAKRVVNFIMQQYEYGGYTKVSFGQTVLNGYDNYDEIYSKFSYKKITYDLYSGVKNSDFRHVGTDYLETYNIEPSAVIRKEQVGDSRKQDNTYPISFRATYTTDKVTARNSIFYTHQTTPIEFVKGTLSYDNTKTSDYFRTEPSTSDQISYSGTLFLTFNDKTSLNLAPTFSYAKLHRNYGYDSPISDNIQYRIAEDIYTYRFEAYLLRLFGNKHRLQFGGNFGGTSNRVSYDRVSIYSDNLDVFFASPKLAYDFSTGKLRFNITQGFAYERIAAGGDLYKDSYPWTWLSGSYKFNNKNQLSASLNYVTSTPGIDMRSSAIMQSNDLLYLGGAPGLRNYRNLYGNISYNYFHSNSFNLAMFCGFNNSFNKVTTAYQPFDNGHALLRTFINDGNYSNLYAGLQVNYKMLDNKLHLYGNVSANSYRTTGIYSRTYNPPVRVQLQGTYYLKDFYFIAYYSNGQHTLTESSNILIARKSFYGMQAGWGNGHWNIRFSINNFFRNSWIAGDWQQSTPLYNLNRRVYGANSHSSLNLSATYTIGYGKKVNQRNEVGEQIGANSAILK